jgi:predicted metalloprotease
MYFRYGVDYTRLLNTGDVREAQKSLRGAGGDKAHGTGRQRVAAFNYGYNTFNWAECNSHW